MKKPRSVVVWRALYRGGEGVGQTVRLSNLVCDEKSGKSQPAQTKVPEPYSLSSGLVPARSVPWSRSTRYCSGVSAALHSPSLLVTSNNLSVVLGLAMAHSLPR